ncbi:39S ribosomal protein L39, mitochondrial-like [Argiope bruennichi]|uniref:39S ribosomal protein L39 like protein n=1 Tax=Argiope bruennichi TaxID=94029 RepID=A0A8T0FUZ6_ARGBR|nr:39S ribosomal protein L39, mitochondrial-like [Argiope bruennichi]KAF8794927.1 39S ribosomal protein L39 like protein [Argiope bruennichi]
MIKMKWLPKHNTILYLCGKRYFSTVKVTNESIRKMKNDMFSEEKTRQQSLITRIEKIEVKYRGVPSDCTLIMNKNMSTPYNCAMHMHEMLCQRSVLAEVNGQLWDMHRPITGECELKLLNFHTAPSVLNKVFWRSCSFLLGLVIERAFKDEYFIDLHSWPKPNVKSGSYVYDVDVGILNWTPTAEELKTLTTMLCKVANEDNNFEMLDVSESLAMKMFQYNRFKMQQIPQLAKEGSVRLYRVKDHVDISYGPMIANTKFVGTTQVTAIHRLDTESGYRFQAVSIPKQLTLNSFAFSVLVDRAKKLNETGLASDSDEKSSATA